MNFYARELLSMAVNVLHVVKIYFRHSTWCTSRVARNGTRYKGSVKDTVLPMLTLC